jgi:class 3 adenylate cyclase
VPVRIGPHTERVRVMTWRPSTLNVVPTAPVGGQPQIAVRGGEAVTLPSSFGIGAYDLEIVNDTGGEVRVLLEDHDMPEYTPDELPVPRLTGIDVVSVPAFRALFHTETLAQHESLAVRDLTVVFTDIERSTELYQRVGDIAAYALVRRHFDIVFAAVLAHDGTIVKTIGDAVMASFVRPERAVTAFVEVQRLLRDLRIRAAVHCGPVVAVTLNDRLDFFGTTVNETARMEIECAPGELIVSDAVHARIDADVVLHDCEVTSEQRVLPGLPGAYRLHRVRPISR